MPVHIERISNEIGVVDGELALSPAQLERLVQTVMQRLEEKQRIERHQREATSLRPNAVPPSPLME